MSTGQEQAGAVKARRFHMPHTHLESAFGNDWFGRKAENFWVGWIFACPASGRPRLARFCEAWKKPNRLCPAISCGNNVRSNTIVHTKGLE